MIIKEVTCAYKRIKSLVLIYYSQFSKYNILILLFLYYCQNRNRNIQANQTAEHCIRNYFPSPRQFGYIQLEIVVSILAVFLSHLHSNKNKQLSKHTYSVQDHLRLLKKSSDGSDCIVYGGLYQVCRKNNCKVHSLCKKVISTIHTRPRPFHAKLCFSCTHIG